MSSSKWDRIKRVVAARDGCCVRCRGESVDVHHRKLKGLGGTSDDEVAYGTANLITLCRTCHTYVHGNPTESYKTGYLVHSWDDPELIGVITSRGIFTFSSDGTFEQTGPCDLFLHSGTARWYAAHQR